MAGIYIHIPFCKQKCHYCNFFSIASVKHKAEFIRALQSEIRLQKDYLQNEEITTIYWGGGTPSLLNISEIESIYNELKKHHRISENAEITIEANPDDLTPLKISQLSKSFINRLSIGVQSFFDDDLKYLNRIHQSNQSLTAIRGLQDAGLENISIDLIYGIPTLNSHKWNKNLELFFSLNLPHLSAYSLTVEPQTALNLLIAKKKVKPVRETQSIAHFKELIKQTQIHDYIHYEISNFSRKGYYSKHNSLYWLGGNYLGLGPSAHSYNGKSRQWNVSNLSEYLKLDLADSVIFEREELSKKQRFNEYVMTSLRTTWGCDLEHIENVFGRSYKDHLSKEIVKFLTEQKVEQKGSIFYLTQSGKLFADGIASELFLD